MVNLLQTVIRHRANIFLNTVSLNWLTRGVQILYKELDEFITECQYMVDYWYDVGCIIAVEKLAQFNATD